MMCWMFRSLCCCPLTICCVAPYVSANRSIPFCCLPFHSSVVESDWNIISVAQTAAIAGHVPMSIDELNAMGILGENIIKEYGDRLIKNIRAFVETENLQQFIDRRPKKRPMSFGKTPAKKQKIPSRPTTTTTQKKTGKGDDADEFDADIDYNLIDMT